MFSMASLKLCPRHCWSQQLSPFDSSCQVQVYSSVFVTAAFPRRGARRQSAVMSQRLTFQSSPQENTDASWVKDSRCSSTSLWFTGVVTLLIVASIKKKKKRGPRYWVTYVAHRNAAHFYFQRTEALVCLWGSLLDTGAGCAHLRALVSASFVSFWLTGWSSRTVGEVFVATGAARDRSVNEMQKDKLFRANIAADSMSLYCHKVLTKARQLRIESIVKEWKKKKLIKTDFMHLQDVHFTTIAPFKILSAPKIAKALAYLTDSNLNKTTVK